MWSMWDAPSDRDYYEQFNPSEDPGEDPDNIPEDEITEKELNDDAESIDCPF